MARQERSAGVVAFRCTPGGSRQYLLLDYGRHWDFPKGHVEENEDDLAAAVRELKEETGISGIELIPAFKHEITYFFRDRKKGLVRKTVVFFLGQTHASDGQIVISHEHEGFEFLPYDAAIKRITFANARRVLELAEQTLDRLSKPTATS